MADQTTKANSSAKDEDIEAIVRENEAGVQDLLDAYEVIERHYFAVATAPLQTITYSTNTSTR